MTTQSRSVVVRLSAETAQYIREMQKAGKVGTDAMTKVSKHTKDSSAALDDLGGKAGKVGLVAGAAFAGIVASAANFDEAMSHVAATGEDARGSLEALRKEALEAGARTKFSATEAAAGIEALEKAGVGAKDILAGGLDGALDLAASGQLAVADAAEITATALTQFQLEGTQATHVADLLAAGAGKAQGEVADMALALKYAGVPAANLGVSIEETAGTIALFAKNGIIGEQAGTSLRGMLASLTSPSDVAAQEMSNLGLSVFDAQGKFIGLEGVAGVLNERLKKSTDEERAYSLGRIFGNEQLQAANVLYREGAEGVRHWTAEVNDAGYAADSAGTKMDNLKGDLEQLKGSLETALIGAGDGAQGPLRELTQDATGLVNAFTKLPQPVQSSLTGLLGITAVVGGAAWFGSKVVNAVSNTRESLSALGVESEKVGRTMRTALSVTAVIAGIEILDQTLDALYNRRFDGSNLDRSLTALASGKVAGEIRDKYGKDLKGFGEDLDLATAKVTGLNRAVSDVPIVGGFLSGDWLPGRTTQTAIENLDDLDKKLASLVETGQEAAAADIFKQLEASASDAGVSTDELSGVFDAYGLALKNSAHAADEAATATGGLAAANDNNAVSTAAAAVETAAQAEALQKQRDAATASAQQFVGLGDSVNDAKVSLSGWLTEMEKQAQALRDFTANAKEAADNGLRAGLINALEEMGPEGALRMQQLADASDAEITRANRAWARGQRAMAEYVNFKVPPKKLTVDASQAIAEVNAFKALYSTVRNKKVTITANHADGPGSLGGLQLVPGSGGKDGDPTTPQALGGFYPGIRHYAGGGMDLANNHQPEIAAAGDWRVFAEPETGGETYIPHANDYRRPAAKRYLEQTANLFGGEVAWYAGGGERYGSTFQRRGGSGTTGGGFGDVDRLISAMGRMRSIAGTVNIQPNNYNEFLREEAQLRRLAGADGVRAT